MRVHMSDFYLSAHHECLYAFGCEHTSVRVYDRMLCIFIRMRCVSPCVWNVIIVRVLCMYS